VLSYDNQHIAARLVHTRFPLPVRRKRKEQEMGTDTTFSAAVAAIVAHHAKLYELLLSVFPAYRGECEMPPRENRASRILDCEKNDAHRLLENLATAAKSKPRGTLDSAPDTLIAECRDFLAFLETNLPSPDCAAAISDICQIEEAFVNFIKGVSGGDPSMSRRAYSLRIDKFVRDMKASFRSLGHSIVKLEYELTQLPAKTNPPPDPAPAPNRKKRGRIGSGLHGKRTSCMEEQLSNFRNFVKDHPIRENDRTKTLGARASQYWKRHEKTMNHASQCLGENKGFKSFKSLANAFRNSKQ
jgi:hypothetical protein